MPDKFVSGFVDKGLILFRNLTYFRQYEDIRRGDPLEGFHRDNPENDVTLSCPKTGRILAKGDFSFLNSTNTDLIFVFCMSRILKDELYKEFETNTCIEITEPLEFTKRVHFSIKKLLSPHKNGLLTGDVNYYRDNAPVGFDVKDPKNLAFAKGNHYEPQKEFRLVFGTTKRAFDLKQQIVVNRSYDFLKEAKNGQPKEKLVKIGCLRDITKVHRI